MEGVSQMPQAIGLRIYKVYFTRRGSRDPIKRDDLPFDDFKIVKDFVANHSTRTKPDGSERSWYFERPQKDDTTHVTGLVEYGTSGFSSKLLDIRTNKKKYDRVDTDVEQIPLFFDFWLPPSSSFLMVALQSFGTRSCVDLIQGALRVFADSKKPQYMIHFKKLMPNDSKNALFGTQPVKRLTFVATKSPSDVANSLIPFRPSESVDVEISVKSGRGRGLGPLSQILKKISHRSGIFEYEGVEFTKAHAEIRVAGRLRRIGVFGPSSDAGTIDITEDVVFSEGHPTFKSIVKQANTLLAEFYDISK